MADLTRAEAYELRIGRWSRLVAQQFLGWLAPAPGLDWLDVGCGTGVLSDAVLERSNPRSLAGIDPQENVVRDAQAAHSDPRAAFHCVNAQNMPFDNAIFDVVVSGLVINFIEDQPRALSEMKRVLRPGGQVAAYVWDFAGDMELFRVFWDSARALDAEAVKSDQGERFPVCKPGPLGALFEAAGFENVGTSAIMIDMPYRDFADFWVPMTRGAGGIPDYVKALDPDRQAALETRVHDALPIAADGSFTLRGRAWAVRGLAPGGQ
ncbi:MAG: methyltransferase domain-containing protein [Proteobacteria bacterium]|nr:methyltransferase domain-containing protein [Pseudomonadota bacterium]